MLTKIIKIFGEAQIAMEEYNLRRYLQAAFYDIFNLIQDFYRDTENTEEFLIIFKIIYKDWLKILSITLPHLCEELWEMSGNEGFISKAIWGDFNKHYINENLEIEFNYISNVISDIFNIKKIVKSEKIDNIYLYTAHKWKYNILNLIISKNGKFNDIMSELKKVNEDLSNKNLITFIKNQIKERNWELKIPKIEEVKLLKQYKSYIENRVNLKITINSEYDPKRRSVRAKPFKPALYIDA